MSCLHCRFRVIKHHIGCGRNPDLGLDVPSRLLNLCYMWIFFSFTAGFVLLVLIIFTNPSARAGYDTRSIFKRSLTGLISEFSFSYTSCLTKAEEPNLSYYLPIAGGRIVGFIPFPRVLVRCENAISRVQVLNSCRRVHFLRR